MFKVVCHIRVKSRMVVEFKLPARHFTSRILTFIKERGELLKSIPRDHVVFKLGYNDNERVRSS